MLGYPIFECRRCPHRQLAPVGDPDAHVRDAYGDAYFTAGGAGYPGYLDDEDLFRAHGAGYARRLERAGIRPGQVLDIGCGPGFLLSAFIARGAAAAGIEPNAAMAELARARGVLIVAETADRLAADAAYDLVTMVQVIAHLDRPGDAVARAARAVRPGGHLLIETWNLRSLPARVLGAGWHEYQPPVVRHWFSRRGLDALLRSHGLTPLGHGRPRKRISWRHARSLLRTKLPALLARALDRVPLSPGAVLPYPPLDLFFVLAQR